ncbi:homocysteine S-methyltransferase family protein [Xiamenia xianingshaonis]|uniref:Homocysteine S-methyltransferase family protein n=1 Tax=Xiamenia xianingshaonis TaxID=2682776 RepID=A0A9E6SUG7_9ACTN|nr:homocysteine S-methyltransferase family protein [Xiamenia xianingshaonis]NHM13451.1 methionine synthase [Xiamenia xianingshaonis]QTU84471.1 homocysteine S-methyltransferase family protein [Xiamenia xianingshaonis]
MPDISLRFHKDMLVLSSPIDGLLRDQGFDLERDLEYASTLEPESLRDQLRLNAMAGAAVLVAPLAGLTPARLAHQGFEDRAADVAASVAKIANGLRPQHLLLEIGPCGLPLDPASKASLDENRDQYARAARACAGLTFDALFLNGFASAVDLKCALMGVRQASDAPVFASISVDAAGVALKGGTLLEDAVAMMGEYGAAVAGFATKAGPDAALALAKRAVAATPLPVLVALEAGEATDRPGIAGLRDDPENPYANPDALVDVAVRLRAAGVQFLRCEGAARPAHAGALAVAVSGRDVARPDIEEG